MDKEKNTFEKALVEAVDEGLLCLVKAEEK